MPDQGVHRAGPRGRGAAGVVDHAGVLVGGQPDPSRNASISGIARQLGTTWNTVWTSIEPLLQEMADDETRFAGVKRLGVDEHVAPRQRVPHRRRRPWPQAADRDGRSDSGSRVRQAKSAAARPGPRPVWEGLQ